MPLSDISEIQNHKLRAWVEKIITLCQPADLYLCDGSQEEYESLCKALVQSGTWIALNPQKRPDSFLARSHPDDVARSEQRTFICSENPQDVGPTNNWRHPEEMRAHLLTLFKGCMEGRTLYIIPFSMGPLNSPMSRIGVEITDSPYVVCNMHLMTRTGGPILDKLGQEDFVQCLHSVGVPLKSGESSSAWPCNPDKLHIVHFADTHEIWSFGSGYGGNALLGKKSFALRIASQLAYEEGWLAEHMLILGITSPEGQKKYIAAAFPSACGKTNLAMLQSTLPGWKIETVGDDIAWMHFREGQLYAINPEAGFFGVAPGTSLKTNPSAMATIARNTLFTNVALTPEGDVWWENMTSEKPPSLTDWRGQPWTPESLSTAAHPNARFTVPASQCPVIDPLWEDPRGVPISALLFGGRRSTTTPLVYEAFDWAHGVFLGASVSSETTAAAVGVVGMLRHDPFAMLPFCGYNMGDYFKHWLNIARKSSSDKLPKVYAVNWFRKDKGKFLWPGFGENMRVLKWIFERIEGKAEAKRTPIGFVPTKNALDLQGLKLAPGALDALFAVPKPAWREDLNALRNYLLQFRDHLPEQLLQVLSSIQQGVNG